MGTPAKLSRNPIHVRSSFISIWPSPYTVRVTKGTACSGMGHRTVHRGHALWETQILLSQLTEEAKPLQKMEMPLFKKKKNLHHQHVHLQGIMYQPLC